MDEASPPLVPPAPPVIEVETDAGRDEENIFPGADSLSVADVVQVNAAQQRHLL